jgi:hypothetical protein
MNPAHYLFDHELAERTGTLQVKYALPYSDVTALSAVQEGDDRDRESVATDEPIEFSHTLEDQIGGQLDAGFVITGFYEDVFSDDTNDPVSRYMATLMATRAIKPE